MKYMISKQGNRGIAFGRDENVFFTELTEAKADARRRTKQYAEDWWVLEVTATPMYAFRVAVKEEDWSGTSE